MLTDVVSRVVDSIREVEGVVALHSPDHDKPHLLRVVASRPPIRVATELIECVERSGMRLRYFVYGPAPVPWTRIYVYDDEAQQQYTVSVTYTWG